MYRYGIISPNAADKARQGRPGHRPNAPYVAVPLPSEEKRLNFKLKELLEDTHRVMMMEGGDEPKKWQGVEGLMQRMQNELPYLINADTRLELCFKDKIGDETYEMQGPLSYSQFVEALKSTDTMNKHHEYIASQHVTVGNSDHRRATLRAENMLLMLYSALRYELERHEDYMALFDDDAAEAPADNVVRMPHFGMESSKRAQERWESAYQWLATQGYIKREEINIYGWIYVCCGQQQAPKGPVVWHKSTAALAYIIRSKFNGQWDIAKQIFCLDKGRVFPDSFNTTHNPVDWVMNSIDRAFQTANSH